MGRARDRSDEVQSITSAPVARSEDIAHRQKVYLVQMGVRVLAFLGKGARPFPVRPQQPLPSYAAAEVARAPASNPFTPSAQKENSA